MEFGQFLTDECYVVAISIQLLDEFNHREIYFVTVNSYVCSLPLY